MFKLCTYSILLPAGVMDELELTCDLLGMYIT